MAERVAYGGDVGNNPYLDATFDRASQAVRKNFQQTVSPGLAGRANMSGRLGSGAYARMRNDTEQQVGESLSGLASQIYGGAYENERRRQMQAMRLASNLAQQDAGNRFNAAGIFDTGLDRTLQAVGMTPQAMAAQHADDQRLLDVASTERDLRSRPYRSANAALAGTELGRTVVSGEESNPIAQGLGLAGGIFGMFRPRMRRGRRRGVTIVAVMPAPRAPRRPGSWRAPSGAPPAAPRPAPPRPPPGEPCLARGGR